MRYFVQFSYFGKSYHGWQKQPNAISVQEVLEHALSVLLRKKIQVVGAGRTDAGVHAHEMFAHFDFDYLVDAKDLVYRLNAFLPYDIAVAHVYEMVGEAHARFDAIERAYEYWVCERKNPFFLDAAHYVRHPLDITLMNNAAQLLLGKQDFECFSKSKTEVNNHFCNIKNAQWSREEECIVFRITADRFLRNMVRAIVGTLLNVGTGKTSLDIVKDIIKSKDRTKAGVSVPAKGLYLTHVTYPNTIFRT